MPAIDEDAFDARVELTLLRSHLQTTDHSLAYLMRYPCDERTEAVRHEIQGLMQQLLRVIGDGKGDADA